MVFAWRKNSGRPEWKIGTFASQRGPPIFLKARCARTPWHIALRQPRATKRKAATACIIAHASDSRAAPSSCGRFDACKMRSVRSLGTCGAQHQLRGWPTGIAASQNRISRKAVGSKVAEWRSKLSLKSHNPGDLGRNRHAHTDRAKQHRTETNSTNSRQPPYTTIHHHTPPYTSANQPADPERIQVGHTATTSTQPPTNLHP